MNNLICNRCYDKDIINKKILKVNDIYKCKLCKENIFFIVIYILKIIISKKK